MLSLAVTNSTGQTGEQKRSAVKQVCKETKPYITIKRKATWNWQDAIFVSRTQSSFADRRTHGCSYLKWIARLWEDRADDSFRFYVDLREPKNAICHVFGSYCTEALAVARCESGNSYSVGAHNGQYLGMFQMGSSEREKYGHGNTPLEQAIAAHEYFVESGKDWSPWSCKP